MLGHQENKTSNESYGTGAKKNANKPEDNISFEEFASQFKIKPYPEPKGPLAPEVVLGGSLPDTKNTYPKESRRGRRALTRKGKHSIIQRKTGNRHKA